MVSESPPLLSSFPLSPIRIIIYIIMLCLSFLYYAFLAEASRLVILPHILIPPFLSDLPVSLHPPPSRNLFCLHLYISYLSAYAHFRCFYTHWLLISVPPMDPLRFVLYTNFFFCHVLPSPLVVLRYPLSLYPTQCPSASIQSFVHHISSHLSYNTGALQYNKQIMLSSACGLGPRRTP